MQVMQTNETERNVDALHFVSALLRRWWIIVLVTVVFAVCAFIYSAVMLTPMYSTSFSTYVNNKLEMDGIGSTSVSDLNASRGLAYVYQSVITSRSVISQAVDSCKQQGVFPVDGDAGFSVSASLTENAPIIHVYVEATDPAFAFALANAIAASAPAQVERVVEGSSMRIIDAATMPTTNSSPNNTRNTLLGAIIGLILSCAVVVALELVFDKAQGEADLEKRYGVTVLGVIPDLVQADKNAGNYGIYGSYNVGGQRK